MQNKAPPAVRFLPRGMRGWPEPWVVPPWQPSTLPATHLAGTPPAAARPGRPAVQGPCLACQGSGAVGSALTHTTRANSAGGTARHAGHAAPERAQAGSCSEPT